VGYISFKKISIFGAPSIAFVHIHVDRRIKFIKWVKQVGALINCDSIWWSSVTSKLVIKEAAHLDLLLPQLHVIFSTDFLLILKL